MKTIFKTIIIASAALVAAGCGNNAGKQTLVMQRDRVMSNFFTRYQVFEQVLVLAVWFVVLL